MPVSIAISTIMIEALTEYSAQRAWLTPRIRPASYRPTRPGAAVSRWSAAASRRKIAMAAAMFSEKKVVSTSSADPGGPVCTGATTGMAKSLPSTRIAIAWIRCARPTTTLSRRSEASRVSLDIGRDPSRSRVGVAKAYGRGGWRGCTHRVGAGSGDEK